MTREGTQAHLEHRARSHKLIRALLRADPMRVDEKELMRVLAGGLADLEIKRFGDQTILDRVRKLGGQFAQARMTEVVGGETLVSQRDNDVIKFWTDWHFEPEEEARLTVGSSIASQVIYLPDLVEGSLNCTSIQVEGKKSVAEIIASLPEVAGLRWIVGNTPTINGVLANHLKETGVYLLLGRYTWTTDEYDGLYLLFVGRFDTDGVGVLDLRPGYSDGNTGLFILGVPV